MDPAPAQDLAAALAARAWAVEPRFLGEAEVGALRARVAELDAAGAFRPAAIGAGDARAVRAGLRGDRLCWFDAVTDIERAVAARLEQLRLDMNRELTLGLFDFESHYAIYPPGARYVRHLDRSARGAERVLSAVLYLNERWESADGGELVIYAPDGPVTVTPAAGTLVLFLSERLEHEVRATQRERMSLVGWFRRRAQVGR